MDNVIAEGGGASIDSDDVELLLKIGPGRALLEDILLRKIAAAMAAERGVEVSDDDVESALNALYAELGFFEPAQVTDWLVSAKVDEAVLRRYMRDSLLKEKLGPALVPDAAVRQRFLASPYDYATLHVQKISLEGRGGAAETLLQLNEAEITWEEAARRAGDMESLVMHRKDVPAEAAADLFVCPLGGFVGPVEDELGTYAVYRVAWKMEPELDDALRAQIRGEMYEEELRAALATAPLRFLR